MNNRFLTGCLAVFILFASAGRAIAIELIPNSGTNAKVLLNGSWKFKYLNSFETGNDSTFFTTSFNDKDWATIKVPGNWELQGFAKPYYGYELKEGTGLYRTSVVIPFDWKNNPVFIAFDGVLYGYKFWVNGKYAGTYNSSYNRKVFDISSFVKAGQVATLAVEVTTRPKGWEFDANDCWALSGIYRDVTLFCLPSTHMNDLTVTTEVEKNNATVNVSVLVGGENVNNNMQIELQLQDSYGEVVASAEMLRAANSRNADSIRYKQELKLSNANLWTAETPYLYTLVVQLKDNKSIVQTYRQKVGIRQITWDNGVFKINGKVVKLRGVNHHDLSPVNGRSVTEAEMLEDLKLIREGNANFIRASHYPPHPRFMELCDSMGFYMIDEVPFGYGDEHLNDKEYLPDLMERARATIARDKNHPCVIAWSVGNENPLTRMCLEVGRYVKSLDATRPYSYPQVGSYFRKICDTIPEDIDILSPHYPVPSYLNEYSKKFNRPFIVTEYAHSLGLDFDRMEALWEIMYNNTVFAGGAVWHLFDQGILQKSDSIIGPDEFTTSVWLDSVTCYNNFGNKGADGIMYANRIPQVDYYEMRKVYTPVKAIDDTLQLALGKVNRVAIGLINRYDFTNLDQVKCSWKLMADTLVLSKGDVKLSGEPHDTAHVTLDVKIPEKVNASFVAVQLSFTDNTGYTFYEKSYPVEIEGREIELSKLFDGKFSSGIDLINGNIHLQNGTSEPLVMHGPYARIGRKTTMSEITVVEKKDESPVWNPNLMQAQQSTIITDQPDKKVMNYTYERGDVKGQFVDAQVCYTLKKDGSMDVSYTLTPRDANGIAIEAGISFIVPEELSEFRWVGKGPYPAYPGKSRLSEFGIYHLNSNDLNYQGNRQEVDLALITNAAGAGFAVISNKSNLAVERSSEGIVVSLNAKVSGRYNKNSAPEKKVHIKNGEPFTGSFTLVPLSENWTASLQQIFGKPNVVAVPFKPFYNSYDQ